jgi:dihydroorotase
MMGLELCFGLLRGLCDTTPLKLARLIDALSTRPARIIGLQPPRLKEGDKAELVLVDPTLAWKPESVRLRSKSKNTPFMSRELRGKVMMTIASGTLVHDALGDST